MRGALALAWQEPERRFLARRLEVLLIAGPRLLRSVNFTYAPNPTKYRSTNALNLSPSRPLGARLRVLDSAWFPQRSAVCDFGEEDIECFHKATRGSTDHSSGHDSGTSINAVVVPLRSRLRRARSLRTTQGSKHEASWVQRRSRLVSAFEAVRTYMDTQSYDVWIADPRVFDL